ncbi:IS1-like element transposase [Spirosoma pulveris]
MQTYIYKAHDPLVKEKIIQLVLNGAGVRDTAVNQNTVSTQFKKVAELFMSIPCIK